MDKIIIYTVPELQAIVKGAARSNPAGWAEDLRSKVAKMIADRPGVYRTFGPWWWPLKAQLIDAGLLVGEPNPVKAEAISTGQKMLDLAGAVAYHGYCVDNMIESNTFTVGTESGDTLDYVLDDPEFDERIAAG
jgi:hypothetical protein